MPEEYWTITAKLSTGKADFEAKFYSVGGNKKDLKNEAEVKEVLQGLSKSEFVVSEVKEKERHRNPSPPFITSSLQQEAARKLGFRASKTMSVAQQLYEGIDLGPEARSG